MLEDALEVLTKIFAIKWDEGLYQHRKKLDRWLIPGTAKEYQLTFMPEKGKKTKMEAGLETTLVLNIKN